MDDEVSPECQALIDAAQGMSLDELEQELSQDPRVADARTLAAYLLSMGG